MKREIRGVVTVTRLYTFIFTNRLMCRLYSKKIFRQHEIEAFVGFAIFR